MKATYIHGPGIDEPLMMSREGSNYFYHTDGLGSVVGLSNDLGEIESTNGIKNPYGYTGREMDTESDLYYYRARYYNPNSGRFISSDPIGFGGGDANLYRYVSNNPHRYVDPFGEFNILPFLLKKVGEFIFKKKILLWPDFDPNEDRKFEEERKKIIRNIEKKRREIRKGCGVYRSCEPVKETINSCRI